MNLMNLRVKMMIMMMMMMVVKRKKNKRLPEEISITSDMQVTPSLWQKEPFEESGRGE